MVKNDQQGRQTDEPGAQKEGERGRVEEGAELANQRSLPGAAASWRCA